MLLLNKNKQKKIFCIGRNKTGTTSLEMTLKELGYKLGDQKAGEKLMKDYSQRNWKPIIQFCKTADAFQDAPFSWPFTWLILAHQFPDSKFILTIRDEESWYKSQVNFHIRQFAKNGQKLKKEDMLEVDYNYKGYLFDMFQAVWKTPENDLYNKKMMIENYKRHNNDVIHYFKGLDNLLVIDISDKYSYLELCDFLEKNPKRKIFPHLNKS